MAMIEVKGIVNKVFYNDTAVELVESFKTKDGNTVKRYYSVWLGDKTSLTMGQTIQVRGLLSAKIDEYKNKDGEPAQKLAMSINNPVVTTDNSAPATSVPAMDEAPF